MPYTPQPGDSGAQLLLVALRDYLATDTLLMALLAGGSNGIVPEGFLTDQTPTPILLPTVIGDGAQDAASGVYLFRFLFWAVDRGRGYAEIERILTRVRELLNDNEATQNFLTFPVSEPMSVLHTYASGSTASTTLPRYNAEARGLYVFVSVMGLPTVW